MKKYSQNIQIEVNYCGYTFELEGKLIQIYESAPLMDVWLFSNIASIVSHFMENIQKNNSQAQLQYETSVICDMCDLIIKQENNNIIRVISQFYDGSDQEEIIVDAKAFYKEFVRTTETYLQTVEKDESLAQLYQKSARNAYTLENWKKDVEVMKQFLEKYPI